MGCNNNADIETIQNARSRGDAAHVTDASVVRGFANLLSMIDKSNSTEALIAHTRTNDVSWEGGTRGEGLCVPTDKNIAGLLKEHGLSGIKYHRGIPDFSDIAITEVSIETMTSSRSENFGEAGKALIAESEGLNSVADVNRLRQQEGYTWHECSDAHTMQLVPTEIHDFFKHSGGVSEVKTGELHSFATQLLVSSIGACGLMPDGTVGSRFNPADLQ